MTSGDLHIDLSKKLTKYFRNDFWLAFERIFGFSLGRLGYELEGGGQTSPQHVVENPDEQQGAG